MKPYDCDLLETFMGDNTIDAQQLEPPQHRHRDQTFSTIGKN